MGHTRARACTINVDGQLSAPGRIRVGHWLSLLDISAATFYRWLEKGKIPVPSGDDGKPYWTQRVVTEYFKEGQS